MTGACDMILQEMVYTARGTCVSGDGPMFHFLCHFGGKESLPVRWMALPHRPLSH